VIGKIEKVQKKVEKRKKERRDSLGALRGRSLQEKMTMKKRTTQLQAKYEETTQEKMENMPSSFVSKGLKRQQ